MKVNYFAVGKFLDSFGDKDYKEIVTKTEIAEAVELLGCWFVDKQRDLAKGSKLQILQFCFILLSVLNSLF